MIGKVRFCSGKVRSKVRQRAVLSPCQCGSGAGIHNTIESAAKVKLEWDKLDNKKASAIYTYIPKLSFNDQSNYPDLMNKAIDLVIAIREAFSPFINQYSGD